MSYRIETNGAEVRAWIPPEEIEASAVEQIKATAALPWVAGVAVMPDVHAGVGATVGSVIAMRGAVAPAAVGVDIGCGMAALRTDLRAEDLTDPARLRHEIERAVPVGFNAHKSPLPDTNASEYLWHDFGMLAPEVSDCYERARLQLGTLGGGNHFIEVCRDLDGRLWIMLHSGSRNIGKRLADVHVAKAKTLPHNAGRGDLSAFLSGSNEYAAYSRDLAWALEYARLNRAAMLRLVRGAMERILDRAVGINEEIHCHHNYSAEEEHGGERLMVTRKGAISARAGEWGIIPGSMGTRSYIVRGLGNPDAYLSASHGAGRRMSRGAAKRQYTVADVEAQTAGVECRKDAGIVDEIPGAYKSIDAVMENQRDLVSVEAELRALLCVKG